MWKYGGGSDYELPGLVYWTFVYDASVSFINRTSSIGIHFFQQSDKDSPFKTDAHIKPDPTTTSQSVSLEISKSEEMKIKQDGWENNSRCIAFLY